MATDNKEIIPGQLNAFDDTVQKALKRTRIMYPFNKLAKENLLDKVTSYAVTSDIKDKFSLEFLERIQKDYMWAHKINWQHWNRRFAKDRKLADEFEKKNMEERLYDRLDSILWKLGINYDTFYKEYDRIMKEKDK